jgi:hypothetical protein
MKNVDQKLTKAFASANSVVKSSPYKICNHSKGIVSCREKQGLGVIQAKRLIQQGVEVVDDLGDKSVSCQPGNLGYDEPGWQYSECQ